jgi:hypothetical protein
MPHGAEVHKFVKVASASLPRVSEIIAAFSDEDRAGAFELAERRYVQAARNFGCDEAELVVLEAQRSVWTRALPAGTTPG